MVKVSVKWTTNNYEVDFDPSLGFEAFQAVLLSLTGVSPERQKIMLKGKIIKEVGPITEGSKLILMGSADSIPTGPSKPVVFFEDLSEAEKAKIEAKNSVGGEGAGVVAAGLNNLGNTCYMNATLQSLRGLSDFKENLQKFVKNQQDNSASNSNENSLTLANALGKLFIQLDSTTNPVAPFLFLGLFRQLFPQFNEQNQSTGVWAQQDADECLTQLLTNLASSVPLSKIPGSASLPEPLALQEKAVSLNSSINNLVDRLFSITLQQKLTNKENPEESSITFSSVRKLQCHIVQKTSYLIEGLEDSFKQEIEKRSPLLGRTCLFNCESSIASLPPNLLVQFVRFDFLKDSKEKVVAKILKKVIFPVSLDLMPYCEPELKKSLSFARKILKAERDITLGLKLLNAKKSTKPLPANDNSNNNSNTNSDKSNNNNNNNMDVETKEVNAEDCKPVISSGLYELYSVLTHKGRYSDGGHYVSWVRQGGDEWLLFDDETVTRKKTENILELAGGGDHHSAYICMYRRVDDMKGKDWKLPTAESTPSTAK